MNKVLKISLVIAISVFGVCFSMTNSAQAAGLTVEFEHSPLFKELDWKPGDEVTRWVRVTNTSGETKPIATEAINENDLDGLGEKLNLLIKEGVTTLYNDTLANFFAVGEFFLSNLGTGTQTQYDFTISFDVGSGNPYQGKTLGFDILVGFQGTEGGIYGGVSPSPPPSGFTILDETVEVIDTGETSVTITWNTSYSSTSRVIYARYDGNHTLDLGDIPNYGYDYSTTEDPTKVLFHSVTITGLTPGTTYYFRCISHASPDSISREHSFLTKGVAGEVYIAEEPGEERPEMPGEEIPAAPGEEPKIPAIVQEEIKKPSEERKAEEIEKKPEEEVSPPLERTEMPGAESLQKVLAEKGIGATLTAAIGRLFSQKIILIAAVVIIVGLAALRLFEKKKKKKEPF